ncbi:MAG: Holliday junction resolvase RuvX [Phycisphaeraceae bacterium]
MRYLSIDLGDKRTGLAVGDDITRIVSPLQVIHTADPRERMNAIARAIEEQGPGALVLGAPFNMDGSAGPAVSKARAFADQLKQQFSLPVYLVDERLSSAQADEQMAQTGLTHGQKKARRDALAAAVILRNFLELGMGESPESD